MVVEIHANVIASLRTEHRPDSLLHQDNYRRNRWAMVPRAVRDFGRHCLVQSSNELVIKVVLWALASLPSSQWFMGNFDVSGRSHLIISL